MLRHRKLLATAVLACAALLLPALRAKAAESWQITLKSVETAPGWFKIQAWGKNVSGRDLQECVCELSVAGDGQIQPHSQGPIALGDAARGETLYYEFDVYCPPGGAFTYTVEFTGYIYHRDP